MSEAKTKKVAGVDLSSACFAYVGDEKDTSTWKLPLFIPGNVSLTRNHVKNAIARFAETKGIPVIERATVWQMIAGAAKAQGISVQRETPEPAKSETVKPVQLGGREIFRKTWVWWDMSTAAAKSRDELLKEVPEQDIVLTLRQTLERTKRWYELHDRPIISTDIACYLRAFEEIVKLDAWPDEKPGNESVN